MLILAHYKCWFAEKLLLLTFGYATLLSPVGNKNSPISHDLNQHNICWLCLSNVSYLMAILSQNREITISNSKYAYITIISHGVM